MMSVSVEEQKASLRFAKPVVLFAVPIADRLAQSYDVTGDGAKFVVIAKPEARAHPLHIVTNWTALLPK